MLPLYRSDHFTFWFEEPRIVPRFHLQDVEPGTTVSVFKLDPGTSERSDFLTSATVSEDGWVELPEPIIVRAGEGFVAVPATSTGSR